MMSGSTPPSWLPPVVNAAAPRTSRRTIPAAARRSMRALPDIPGYHVSTIERRRIEKTVRLDQDRWRPAQDTLSRSRPGAVVSRAHRRRVQPRSHLEASDCEGMSLPGAPNTNQDRHKYRAHGAIQHRLIAVPHTRQNRYTSQLFEQAARQSGNQDGSGASIWRRRGRWACNAWRA
jgi:hypothetical protein